MSYHIKKFENDTTPTTLTITNLSEDPTIAKNAAREIRLTPEWELPTTSATALHLKLDNGTYQNDLWVWAGEFDDEDDILYYRTTPTGAPTEVIMPAGTNITVGFKTISGIIIIGTADLFEEIEE